MTSGPTTSSSLIDRKKEHENLQADSGLDLSSSILNQLNKLEKLSKKYSSLKQREKDAIDGVSGTKTTKFLQPKVTAYPGRAGRSISSSMHTITSVKRETLLL